jgi:hypothetical protein
MVGDLAVEAESGSEIKSCAKSDFVYLQDYLKIKLIGGNHFP